MTDSHRGFTLWNIIAIIAAFVMIAAVVFPLVAPSRENHGERRRNCGPNLKSIALGALMYSRDNDNKLPPVGTVSQTLDAGWSRTLQPYIKSDRIFQCYADPVQQDDKPSSMHYTDYFLNSRLAASDLSKLNAPARIILAGDGEAASSDYACSSLEFCTGSNEQGPVGRVPEEARTRHEYGANYVFGDAHVKWLKPSQFNSQTGEPAVPEFGFR